MKKLIGIVFLSLLLVQMGFDTLAQDMSGSKIVCDVDAVPIDLGEDVVGVNLSAQGGHWDEVESATNTSTIIEANVSNVFVALDRQPGIYTFIYTATNNACLDDGKTAIAVVEILETPKPQTINLSLCPGDTYSLDLREYVSQTLKNQHPGAITYKVEGVATIPTNGVYEVSATDEGLINATYEITTTPFPCDNVGAITINITRDGTISEQELTAANAYCISELPTSLNLNNEMGLSGNGSWTGPSVLPVTSVGVVDLTGTVNTGTYTYNYTFTGGTCSLTGVTATYVVTITDDLSNLLLDKEMTVCKADNPTRVIDMLNVLEIGIPVNSGEWMLIGGYSYPSPVDVTDGFFEVADASGGDYSYVFKVSEAANLCGLAGKTATITIHVEDGTPGLDGEVQICSADVPTEVDLSEFIAGVNSDATWYKADGVTVVPNGKVDLTSSPVGTYKYIYQVGSTNCSTKGNLYITITDELTNFQDEEVKYCLTDPGADAIDLDQVLGVTGVPGSWSNDNGVTSYDGITHIFDGKAEAESVGTYPQTYTFTFTADGTAGCGLAGKSATVTVIITDELDQ